MRAARLAQCQDGTGLRVVAGGRADDAQLRHAGMLQVGFAQMHAVEQRAAGAAARLAAGGKQTQLLDQGIVARHD